MKIKKENLVTPKESTTIKELHEEWAVKNGYRNEDLNAMNTKRFTDYER